MIRTIRFRQDFEDSGQTGSIQIGKLGYNQTLLEALRCSRNLTILLEKGKKEARLDL